MDVSRPGSTSVPPVCALAIHGPFGSWVNMCGPFYQSDGTVSSGRGGSPPVCARKRSNEPVCHRFGNRGETIQEHAHSRRGGAGSSQIGRAFQKSFVFQHDGDACQQCNGAFADGQKHEARGTGRAAQAADNDIGVEDHSHGGVRRITQPTIMPSR